MTDDRPIFVTRDSAMLRKSPMASDVDRAVVASDGGLMEVTPEQLLEFARQASDAKARFDRVVERGMTLERAKQIKVWRCMVGCTWRRVAELASEQWGTAAKWSPPSNQLAGLALCETAARRLGEDPEREPWN